MCVLFKINVIHNRFRSHNKNFSIIELVHHQARQSKTKQDKRMCIDQCLHCFFGGPFRNYQLRLLGFEESKEYDKDSIQDDEHFIGILCFCQKEVRCAELLCYFTTFKRTHCALGFHCHTHPHHRRRGLIKALMQIAVCLLPVFKQRVVMAVNPSTPFVIGCQSINPIVFHSMQTSLGCTMKQEDTYALVMRKIRLKCDVHPPPLPTEYPLRVYK